MRAPAVRSWYWGKGPLAGAPVAFLLFAFFAARAQTPDSSAGGRTINYPPVVVTATRIPTDILQVNRMVETVRVQEFPTAHPSSLDDLLRLSTTCEVLSRGPFGVQSDFSIRGALYSQYLLLLNGQRVNDPQTPHHNFDLPVAIDEIERIEIVKGPGSTMYGADAFSGVVNIITHTPTAESATLRLCGGQHGLVSALGNYAAAGKLVSSSNTLETSSSNGFREDTEFSIWNFTSNNTLWLAGMPVSAIGGYTKKRFGAFDFYSPGANAPSRENTATTWVSLGTSLHSGNFTIQPKALYRRHDDEFTFAPGYPANVHRTHLYSGELTAAWQPDPGTSLLAGVAGSWDRIASSNLGAHHREVGALFVSVQTALARSVTCDAGARLDAHSAYGNQLTPTFGLGYHPSKRVKIYASAGRSFRAPSYTELYYADPRTVGNDHLAPETGWSYEWGMQHDAEDGLMVDGAVFLRDGKDLIDYVQYFPNDRAHAVNFTSARTRGSEFKIQWTRMAGDAEPAPGLQAVSLGYIYLDSRIDRSVIYSARYSLSHPRHHVTAMLQGTLPGACEGCLTAALKVRAAGKSWTVADITVRKNISALSIFVNGSNIFNTPYEEIIGVPQPGRWLWTGLEVKLL